MRWFRWLYPSEAILVVLLLCSVILYSVVGIAFVRPVAMFTDRAVSALTMYVYGFAVAFLMLRLCHIQTAWQEGYKASWLNTGKEFKQTFLSIISVIQDLRFVLIVVMLFVVHIQLKHLIPSLNQSVFDSTLIDAERWLLGGRTATEYFIDAFGISSAGVWSSIYFLFYGYMAVLVFVFVFQRDRILAHEFFSAFALMWGIGIFTVYCVPTWGPCFYVPETISKLPITEVQNLQDRLWQMGVLVRQNPYTSNSVYLISGLPSLHCAIVFSGTYYLWRLNKVAALVSLLFAVMTVISTIYFGWHYLSDDIAAVGLVLVSVRLSKWLCAVWGIS